MTVSRRARSKSASARSSARPTVETLELRRLLTVAVWTGDGGGDSNFTDPVNWQGDIAPTAGQDIDFPSSAHTNTVTIDSPVTVGNVEFDGSYVVSSAFGTSAAMTLEGNLTATVGAVEMDNPIVLAQDAVFEANDAALLQIDGTISDAGNHFGIDKQGNGELEINGTGNSYTGETSGDGGTLIVSSPITSGLNNHVGTTFYGSSTIQSIDGSDGTFSPATFDVDNNTAAPATLTVSDGINFLTPSNATMNFDIDGPGASSEVVVNGGTITLGDTTLGGTAVTGYTPAPGAVITLVQNNTGEPISGTFLNLPQGATTAINGVNYTISYTGGTNHEDVTLTSPGSASNPDITSFTTSASTHGYTIAASVVASDTSAGGTADLTYTWSTVHLVSGAKSPTFSVNGTNAAKNVTARFYKDGTYILECTVKDHSGSTAECQVLVVVQQKATSIKIEPHGAKVAPGHKEQYAVTILDQFAHPMRTAQVIDYSVSRDGSISDTGLFTAGTKAESLDVDVTSDNLSAYVGATVT